MQLEWSLWVNEGSWLNLKTTPRNYGFLKRIKSADNVVSDGFKDQQKVLTNGCETCFHDILETKWMSYRNLRRSLSANSLWWILAVQIRRCRRKVLFSDLKFINMTHERFSNLTVLNSHKLKERTAKSPIPHTHTHTSKEVVTGPLTFKNAPRAVLHAAAVVWSWVKKLTSYSSFEEFFGLHRYSLVDFTVAWLLAWYRVD